METETQLSAPEVQPQQPDTVQIEKEEIMKKIKGSASWFFWIAGLSIINSLINAFSENNTSFLAGLGMTQFIDGIFIGLDGLMHYGALVVNILIAGGFVLIGRQSMKPSRSAYIMGMGIYVLDALLFLAFGDYMSFGFHIFVLAMLYNGFSKIPAYRALEATGAEEVPAAAAEITG